MKIRAYLLALGLALGGCEQVITNLGAISSHVDPCPDDDGGTDAGYDAGPPAVAIPLPVNQSVLTAGAVNTLTATITGGSSGAPEFFADGTSIGTSSAIDAGVYALDWTPSSTDYDVTLTARYDAVDSAPVTVAVAEANHITTALTSWSKTNITSVTGGQADPFGGTGAYRVLAANTATAVKHYISRAANAANVSANPGEEIWAKADTASLLMFYWLEDGAKHYCYLDLTTGQSLGQWASAKIVESRPDGWKRVWFRSQGGTATQNTIQIYIAKEMANGGSYIADGTEAVYLYAPRVIDGPLPFTPYQLTTPSYVGVVNGAHRWMVRTPYCETVSQMTQPNRYTEVVLPDAYDPDVAYPVLYVAEVEPRPNSYPDGLQVLRALNVHNDYSVILAHTHFGGIIPWYGTKSDGTSAYDVQFADVAVGVVDEFYSTIKSREGRLVVGFSKGGFGAFSLILRRPEVFGYAAAWDVPWTLAYGDYETAAAFGSSAQFDLYNPIGLLSTHAAGVSDRTRLVLAGSYTFGSHLTPMSTALTAQSIPYTLRTGSYSGHNWNTGWLPDVLADLFALRGAP